MSLTHPQIRQAFELYDREVTIKNFKVASVLGMILMPAFAIIDYSIYPELADEFLLLRLACSALIGLFLLALLTRLFRRYHRFFWMTLLLLPSTCISYMIYRTQGANSPYYAGLNLVLLVMGFILRWTFQESLLAVFLVMTEYITACDFQSPFEFKGIVINNISFLVSTGIIVVTGNYFFSQSRFREFVSRYELDESKRELEQTNRRLIELGRLKSRFFANVSHELRTPLTLLLAPLENLANHYGKLFDQNARELLVTMQVNGMRLLKLINDLLDLIRLEAGRMDIKNEPLAVADFVKGLASAVRPMAADKQLQLETHVAAELEAVSIDRDKIEKIALNLLFNALKFTPAGGRVELRAEKSSAQSQKPEVQSLESETQDSKSKTQNFPDSETDEFVISVRDTGIGIAKKNLPFVFDRFWQADGSAQRKHQGVGIGLALVKELTDMMRGSVTVESEEGKGTTFIVRLPYQKADPPKKSEEPESGGHETRNAAGDGASEEWLANLYRRAELFPAAATRRAATLPQLTGLRPVVLVAEDEPDMRQFLKLELSDNYDVVEAANGMDALEKAVQFSPDIILLDMMMPEMDGLEACQALRRRDITANIPIILLTARVDEETKFDALKMGANDFLAKPFSSTELQARIKNLVESHHYQRRLTKQNQALTSAIDQIKETEMQLVQSEKLASLGRLSAGIIHEINNPLNFTLTGLFALRNKSRQFATGQRAEYEEILNDVEEGLKRVRNIVSDLRVFTHPGGGAGEPVDVREVVGAALRFLAGEWKDQVHIEQNLPPRQTVWAGRNKLIHVLVNLLQNSIDALREKKFENGGRPTISIFGVVEGQRSLIVIRDNGPGIEAKLMDKIFDPFFTTKEVGKGMGLGLSICYRIVRAYGGQISVKSEPGKFCEFIVEFAVGQPAAEKEMEHGELLRS